MEKNKRGEKQEFRPKRDVMNKGRRSRKKEVCFEICTEPGRNVCMAGSFNNWQPQELKDNGNTGKYTAIVALPAGRHEYKFIINNIWLHDSNNPNSVTNSFGSLNSFIEV